ncbi:MAG: hypothetical protein DLM60_13450 [Pseudonocardiales bacterium]|nr:hypothetical protein [Actinomycetota bacterium]PZS17529.1 MAG: hypothetical protein DLM60_13450 [Pseudonocardiales bacterium]
MSLDVDRHPVGVPHWASAGHLLPDVLELLTGAPRGTVQTTVVRVDDGRLRLAQVETQAPPAAGTDSALLAAGHPHPDRAGFRAGGIRAGTVAVVGIGHAGVIDTTDRNGSLPRFIVTAVARFAAAEDGGTWTANQHP